MPRRYEPAYAGRRTHRRSWGPGVERRSRANLAHRRGRAGV